MTKSSHRRMRGLLGALAVATASVAVTALATPVAHAEEQPWLDPNLSPDTRAQMMVDQMTLQEKSGLLYGTGTRVIDGQTWQVYVKGIERLGIPDMVQGDAPAGVWQGSNDVTQMPASVALGATFSTDAALTYGDVIGNETRALGYGVIHGPNIDVVRDPRHGRAHETFGEDPFLVSAQGTQYVIGVQEHEVMADAKHYAVNTVEKDRTTTDAQLSRKVLEELHLYPFQDVVEDADIAMVMCAYTKINGVQACNDEYILQTVLRERWGFEGIVRTDAGAAHTLDSLRLGVHQEFRSVSQYGPVLINAVNAGTFPISIVDDAVKTILVTMIEYGIFDNPPQRTGAPLAENAVKAESVAEESIVLLKNEGDTLPLDDAAQSVAVIGASADDALTHGGPANPAPTGKVTVLDAVKTRLPGADLEFVAGADDVYGVATDAGYPQLQSGNITSSTGAHGADAVFTNAAGTTLATRVDTCLCISAPSSFAGTVTTAQTAPQGTATAAWTTSLTAEVAGSYAFDVVTSSAAVVTVDGVPVIQKEAGAGRAEGAVELTAGEHELSVTHNGSGSFKVGLQRPDGALDANIRAAADAAANADVAILVARDLGTESVDRPSLALPNDQDRLIAAVLAANPETVVVLTTGSAVTMPWLQGANAVVEAWYGGTRGAPALASVLFGDVNPSGRLPVTFPAAVADLPTADPTQFPGVDRVTKYTEGLASGYRHFSQESAPEPLFPFGYGLSYTEFAYSNLRVNAGGFEIAADEEGSFKGVQAVTATVDVTNTGDVAGSAVPQLYVRFPEASGEPSPILKGFDKVALGAGETKTVTFELDQRAFSNFSESQNAWVVDSGAYGISVGASSADLPLTTTVEAYDGPDAVKPVATLVSPTSAGPFPTVEVRVDATDERGLDRVVANIYKDGKLVKSTQTAAKGAKAATHVASVSLPDGAYTMRYNASDLSGNIAKTGTVSFTVDATKPKATIKDGSSYTVKTGDTYNVISFKLYDAQKVDKVELNGKVKDLTNNQWSDVNYIKPGTFGAVKGANTLVVFDVAGNTQTYDFTLN